MHGSFGRGEVSGRIWSLKHCALLAPVGRQILRYECGASECSLDFFAADAQADAKRKSGSTTPNCSVGSPERNLTVRRIPASKSTDRFE